MDERPWRRTGETISCHWCAREFYVRRVLLGERKYCTKACHIAAQREAAAHKNERACSECGVLTTVKTGRVREVNFCSRRCAAVYWAKNPTARMVERGSNRRAGEYRSCGRCGKQVYLSQYRIPRFRFCSPGCRSASLPHPTGPDAPGWRGGIARYPAAYRAARLQAIERDGGKCQWDGPHDGSRRLEVHHLNGNRHDNEIANLVTLCSRCHQDWHRKVGAVVAVL